MSNEQAAMGYTTHTTSRRRSGGQLKRAALQPLEGPDVKLLPVVVKTY